MHYIAISIIVRRIDGNPVGRLLKLFENKLLFVSAYTNNTSTSIPRCIDITLDRVTYCT